jgi:hypothetical protein
MSEIHPESASLLNSHDWLVAADVLLRQEPEEEEEEEDENNEEEDEDQPDDGYSE